MGRRMFKSILRRPLLPLFALPLLLAPVPLPAQTAGAPYSIDGRGFSSLQAAVDAIGEGDGKIRLASAPPRECTLRSEERRVGKECARACCSRCSPPHSK